MGIKHLKLPWRFHLMGNHLSCLHIHAAAEPPPAATIKLIKSDGLVKIYDRPINVSELMMEFPKHMVCKSDSFYIGQKVPALSEHEKLQLGQKYFLLPKPFFQSVVSFFTIASFTSSCSKSSASGDSRNAFLKKAASCQPLDIQKTPSGSLRIRVSDEFISQLMEQGRIKEEEEEMSSIIDAKSKLCTTAQLQKDYTLLVGSRPWKPKLETIKENDKKKRRFSSFGMRRRKKSQSKLGNQKNQIIIRSTDHQNRHATKPSSKPLSKPRKIKFKTRK